MFILSYFRKKQNIKVKENTLEHLDDDFIVISDTLNSTSIAETKKDFPNFRIGAIFHGKGVQLTPFSRILTS